MKFKYYYDDEYILMMSEKFASVMPKFKSKEFSNELIGTLDDKELFARFDSIVDAMERAMGSNYSANIKSLFNILGDELKTDKGMFDIGWWLWPIGRYVERHATEDWRLSLSFLKELTKRFTGEFAIRPLLYKYSSEVMNILIEWSVDDNLHVRRLASEGVRIRLPWAKKLTVALDEFEKYTTILTNLKDDDEKFVQKSVGNNLNDLYKEDPEKAEFIINQWERKDESKAQKWVIKHARRNQNKVVSK